MRRARPACLTRSWSCGPPRRGSPRMQMLRRDGCTSTPAAVRTRLPWSLRRGDFPTDDRGPSRWRGALQGRTFSPRRPSQSGGNLSVPSRPVRRTKTFGRSSCTRSFQSGSPQRLAEIETTVRKVIPPIERIHIAPTKASPNRHEVGFGIEFDFRGSSHVPASCLSTRPVARGSGGLTIRATPSSISTQSINAMCEFSRPGFRAARVHHRAIRSGRTVQGTALRTTEREDQLPRRSLGLEAPDLVRRDRFE